MQLELIEAAGHAAAGAAGPDRAAGPARVRRSCRRRRPSPRAAAAAGARGAARAGAAAGAARLPIGSACRRSSGSLADGSSAAGSVGIDVLLDGRRLGRARDERAARVATHAAVRERRIPSSSFRPMAAMNPRLPGRIQSKTRLISGLRACGMLRPRCKCAQRVVTVIGVLEGL